MLIQREDYQSSFDKAIACMVECEHCAKACIGNPDMTKCARMCLDTAEGCRSLATLMVRDSYFIAPHAKACAEVCEACASECEKHSSEHCQSCAKVCRTAAEAYRQIAKVAVAA